MKCILIRGKRLYPVEEEAIRRLAGFYGLQLDAVDVGSPDAVNRAISRLRSTDTLAVLTSQDALSGLDRKRIQAALRRPKGFGISMLVFGVSAGEDANELKFWSGGLSGSVCRCRTVFGRKCWKYRSQGHCPA